LILYVCRQYETEATGKTKIKFVSGSVEAACQLGLADGIVDLVETVCELYIYVYVSIFVVCQFIYVYVSAVVLLRVCVSMSVYGCVRQLGLADGTVDLV